jgi:hypothetical protein
MMNVDDDVVGVCMDGEWARDHQNQCIIVQSGQQDSTEQNRLQQVPHPRKDPNLL